MLQINNGKYRSETVELSALMKLGVLRSLVNISNHSQGFCDEQKVFNIVNRDGGTFIQVWGGGGGVTSEY